MEARFEYRGTEPFSNKRKRALPRSGCVPAMPDMRCTSSVATLVAPASSSPSRQRRYSQPLLTLRLRFGIISLRKELAYALLEWKEYQEDAVKVFKSVPDFCFMKKDWINSGIPLIDGARRHCDFHSLRKTFCTLMEKSGVSQRIAQEAMRHSDQSLTAMVYTDTTQFNMESAVNSLPGFSINTLPLIVPLVLINNGHFLSCPVTSVID